MKVKPQHIVNREELNLRLGIKCSLPEINKLLAVVYTIYAAIKKSEIIFGDEFLNSSNRTAIKLKSEYENLVCDFFNLQISTLNIDRNTFLGLFNNSPLFNQHLESLQVALQLYWKLGEINFEDTSKANTSERTGGNRFSKKINFSTNNDIIELSFSNEENILSERFKSVLFEIITNQNSNDETVKIKLSKLLSIFTEEATYKIRVAGEEIVFQQIGVYEEITLGNTVESNDSIEQVGPLRVLKSSLSDNLNYYIEDNRIEGFKINANTDIEELKNYTKRVKTKLNLSPKSTNIEIVVSEDDEDINKIDTPKTINQNKKLRTIIFESFKYILEKYREESVLNLTETKESKIEDRNYLGLTVPKYFGCEVLVGMFEEQQNNENLKSSGTLRFIDEKIKINDYVNSYFTSQWNEKGSRGLSLVNFNKLLDDISENKLQIIKVDEVFKLIEKNISSKNIIYFGAPGTGKSYKVDKIIENLDSKFYERVTFHPEYDNASFIGGYKPISDINETGEDVIKYQFVPQAFTNIYERAWQDLENQYYLVIEEINRGNCAEIFGEIFQLLDRTSNYTVSPTKELKEYLENGAFNDKEHLGIIKGLKLPSNLSILATMNTSDQSLFPMDSAFKRRWDWEYIPICYEPIDDFGRQNDSHNFKIDIEDGKKYSWIKFIEKINLNHIKNNSSLGMDKCIGNYFVKPDDAKTITLKPFINKVIFYLWNDVFKDEDSKVFEENTSYEDFFPLSTNGKKKIIELFDRIGIQPIPQEEILEDMPQLDDAVEDNAETEA